MINKTLKTIGLVIATISIVACSPRNGSSYNISSGPAPTHNVTPYEAALVCYSDKIKNETSTYISVGNIKDYTGKFSYEAAEGGYKVTQGASLMVMGALSKLGNSVKQVERFDTTISDMELKLSDNKLLQEIVNGKRIVRTPKQGQVIGSQYYIAGGITEVNYNIQSGGAELGIANIGGGARYYLMNIAVDLRLVNTVTLEVVKNVSLQKQVIGTETKAGMFRFFTNTLIDVNVGTKNQEPIQLGVRSALQAATLELVSNGIFTDVEVASCKKIVQNGGYNTGMMSYNRPEHANVDKQD